MVNLTWGDFTLWDISILTLEVDSLLPNESSFLVALDEDAFSQWESSAQNLNILNWDQIRLFKNDNKNRKISFFYQRISGASDLRVVRENMETKENRSPNKKRAFTWGMNDTLKECILNLLWLNTMTHSLWVISWVMFYYES